MVPLAIHPFLIGLLRGADLATVAPLSREDQVWETIIRDATAQDLLPLLSRYLKASDVSRRPPAALLDQINENIVGLVARNVLLAQELASILEAFEAREVACVPMRGLALAELLYGDIAARPMGDLDLLVRKEELQGVATILKGLGFRELDHRPGFARAFSYALEFFKDRHGWVIVEPHWTIAYPPFVDRVDMEAVWKRCKRGRIVGVETWLLDPVNLLVHLCLHLIHQGEHVPLLWFYEIDRLIRQENAALDWAEVSRLARQSGLELLLAEALGQVKVLFESPIPEHVLSQLRAQRAPHRAWVVGRSLESRVLGLLAGGSRMDGCEEFAMFFTLKGFRAKLRYALALLFPSPEFMLRRYRGSTRKQLGLWYVARVMHLSWEGLKWVADLLGSMRTPRQSSPR